MLKAGLKWGETKGSINRWETGLGPGSSFFATSLASALLFTGEASGFARRTAWAAATPDFSKALSIAVPHSQQKPLDQQQLQIGVMKNRRWFAPWRNEESAWVGKIVVGLLPGVMKNRRGWGKSAWVCSSPTPTLVCVMPPTKKNLALSRHQSPCGWAAHPQRKQLT